jgi:hypothetical protein
MVYLNLSLTTYDNTMLKRLYHKIILFKIQKWSRPKRLLLLKTISLKNYELKMMIQWQTSLLSFLFCMINHRFWALINKCVSMATKYQFPLNCINKKKISFMEKNIKDIWKQYILSYSTMHEVIWLQNGLWCINVTFPDRKGQREWCML